MNEREYRKLNQVHNVVKEFEAEFYEAVRNGDNEDVKELIRDVQDCDEIITQLMEAYES